MVNRIAAGEVIERPANVIKELVENSLDASAGRINVEFDSGGKNNVSVQDDGTGMAPEELALSIERHSTSKIKDFSDLAGLTTLGFRGEALSSIASVSRMRIVSRPQTPVTVNGWEIQVEGGKLTKNQQCASPAGTRVEVKELFFNTPARKKFLKSDQTEQSRIIRTLEELALSHCNTGFSVISDKRIVFNGPPTTKPEERLIDILGEKIYGEIFYIESEYRYTRITGFVSRVENSQPTKNLQYFFVNNRPVSNRMLTQAVYDAFRESLPIGRHPMAVIMVELNPQYIDINVHPTKKLVKFSNEREIHDALMQTIKEGISKQKSPAMPVSHIKISDTGSDGNMLLRDSPDAPTGVTTPPGVTGVASPGSAPAPTGVTQELPLPVGNMNVIGQLMNTYLLLGNPEGLLIVDQHAANERVLYEKFLACELVEKRMPVQELLIPFTMELVPHESASLKDNLSELNELGFDISEFGTNTYIFKSVPAVFGGIRHLHDFFKNFVANLIGDFARPEFKSLKPKEKIIRAACTSAIKAHQKLSNDEIIKLVSDLQNCGQPLCCPHGRPTIIRITLGELEKKFLRK